jgi:hypothetical protein
MPVAPTTRFNVRKLTPTSPAGVKTGVLRLPGLANWVAGTVLGIVTGSGAASAVHRITFGGTPTNGSTFRLVYGSEITDPIAFNSTAGTQVANLQAAMDALVGAGNTVVSGTGPYDITFASELSNRAIPAPTAVNNLTGTSPTVTPSLQTAGHPGTGLAGAYNDALSDGTQVARQVLVYDTATDLRGNIITDRPGSGQNSCETYTGGDFLCSELVGLDANGVADLGRLINAAAHTTAGAVIHIDG